MKLCSLSLLFQKTLLITEVITVVVILLHQISLASVCEDALSVMNSSTKEVKDIIEVAKVISFFRGNENDLDLSDEDIIIYPIDIFLSSMTRVVEVDNNQVNVVKAEFTTGTILNSLRALNRGTFLFRLQNELRGRLNDSIKKYLKTLEQEGGYILILDRRYVDSFDSIVSRRAIFDQSSLDLLQQVRLENGNGDRIDARNLLLAMLQSDELYFVQEFFVSQLTESPGLFERWFRGHQRQIDKVRSMVSSTVDMTHVSYTSMLQLQRRLSSDSRPETTDQEPQKDQKAKPVNMDSYLLRKLGFFRAIIRKSINEINNDEFDKLRMRIKKHILINVYSVEASEIESIENEDMNSFLDEGDIRVFLEVERNFTDEEIELFMRRFMKEEDAHTENNIIDTDEKALIPQQRQQLIDNLKRMDQDELAVFIRGLGFEINDDFITHLMDPKKVPRNIKRLFLRFIANVEQAGSISNMRTSYNAHGFKKIRVAKVKRNKRSQRHNYYSLHLDSGDWVVVLIKEGDIFILHQIMSHNTYSRHF